MELKTILWFLVLSSVTVAYLVVLAGVRVRQVSRCFPPFPPNDCGLHNRRDLAGCVCSQTDSLRA